MEDYTFMVIDDDKAFIIGFLYTIYLGTQEASNSNFQLG